MITSIASLEPLAAAATRTSESRLLLLIVAGLIIVVLSLTATTALIVQQRRAERRMHDVLAELRSTLLEYLKRQMSVHDREEEARLERLSGRVENKMADVLKIVRELKNEVGRLQDRSMSGQPARREPERDYSSSSRHDADAELAETAERVLSTCIDHPMTLMAVRELVLPSMMVTPHGDGDPEMPSAFLLGARNGNIFWLIPNTREWEPFRQTGFFEVAGPNLPHARIRHVQRLPRVTKDRHALRLLNADTKGRVETQA